MKKNINTSKIEKLKTIDWLIELFPSAFFRRTNEVKPLKIGICEDIFEFHERLDNPPFSKKQIREALNYYSSSPAYLSNQKINTARVDLFGNEVDVVGEEQAKYAYQRFQERYTNKKTKTSSDNLNEDTPFEK